MEMQGDPIVRRTHGPSAGAVIFLAILFGMVAGFGGTVLALKANQAGLINLNMPAATTPESAVNMQPAGQAISPQQTFAQVAEEMNSSVVNINTLSHQQNPYSLFFGGGTQEVKGLGTGVIIDTKGDILTNYHVVGDAENIRVTVTTKDGKKEYDATLVGGDKQEDLAVVKINAPNLRPVAFGDSDKLMPGEWVMAIGNPFGFEHTVSVGVVSALNRRLPVDEGTTLRGMIQTDASINPGNSGGPLVNLNGQVIGIDTAIFLGGQGQPQASGIGFAIPSNRAQRIMKQLMTQGKIQHPYVGIRYEEITEDIRKSERLPVKEGVIVRDVFKGGPADKAGIATSDVLVSVDGKTLLDANTLADYIGNKSVGAKLSFSIMHWDEGKGQWITKTAVVTIADMPKDFLRSMQPQQQQPQQQPQGNDNNNNGGGMPFPFPF